ncbi:Oligopeptide transporter, OPT superfamily [Dillenia turbinata]|uniref:Oligopeptide transporter, OPT superfamily n=1 Tax=Dillenia turbinata TaxID=194707 RepID=A0AAN8VY73_9MAGN
MLLPNSNYITSVSFATLYQFLSHFMFFQAQTATGFHMHCSHFRRWALQLRQGLIYCDFKFSWKDKRAKTPATNRDKAVENLKENELFLKETISMKMAVTGYLVFSVECTIAVLLMFPELKWHYVVIAYITAPALSFCKAYGAGLTDINMTYNYGKVVLYIIAGMFGKRTGVAI